MDVEQQILKHLARDARSTVSVIDDYCAMYKDLFKEVRNIASSRVPSLGGHSLASYADAGFHR